MIFIQKVCHSDGIPERNFENFDLKKNQQMTQKHNYPEGKELYWGPPRGFEEQENKAIYFKGTVEQMPFFRGTGKQAFKFGELGITKFCVQRYKILL